MAVRKVGAQVELSGEKQYKQALSELNAANKTMRAEMSRLQTEYENNAKSSEFLTQKSELLNDMLLQQQEKVKTLQEAVAHAAQEYGEGSTKTQSYATSLAKAQEEEIKLQRALDQTNEELSEAVEQEEQYGDALDTSAGAMEENAGAMETSGEAAGNLGDKIGGLAEQFGIKLPDGAKKALNAMSGFATGAGAVVAAIGAAVAATVKIEQELMNLSKEYAAQADELITNSAISGLSTTLLQELQYAEPLIDVSVETIMGSMQKLTRNMAEAVDGNTGLAESFEALGVSITNQDGSLRSAQEVFFDLVDALGGVANETERDALAMELLGRSAQDLNPLIKQGTDTLQEYMDEAHDLYVLTEDQVAALGELDDQIQKNGLEWEGLKKQIAAEFAPHAKEALETFGELVKNAGKALIDSGLIDGFGNILEFASQLLKPVADLLGMAEGAPGPLKKLADVLNGIAGAIAWAADAANVLVGLLEVLSVVGARDGLNRIGTALGFGAKSGNYSNMQKWMGAGDTSGNYYNSQTGMWEGNYGRNAAGTDNWRGGLTWVGEAGPELVSLPAGSQIMNAQDSQRVGGDTFYITIDAASVKEFNDIVEMARSARVQRNMR